MFKSLLLEYDCAETSTTLKYTSLNSVMSLKGKFMVIKDRIVVLCIELSKKVLGIVINTGFAVTKTWVQIPALLLPCIRP